MDYFEQARFYQVERSFLDPPGDAQADNDWWDLLEDLEYERFKEDLHGIY